MCVIYFVWYFSIFLLYFSKILATNIDSITSYSKIREEIKSMYVCMYKYLVMLDGSPVSFPETSVSFSLPERWHEEKGVHGDT